MSPLETFVRNWLADSRYDPQEVSYELGVVMAAFQEKLLTGAQPNVDDWTASQQVVWDFLIKA